MTKLIKLYIDGEWTEGSDGKTIQVINPATEKTISEVAVATEEDLTRALDSVKRGFENWRNTTPSDRAKLIHKAASLMRDRIDEMAEICTIEQGKPLGQSRFEIMITANYFDDLAERAQHISGKTTALEPSGVFRNIRYEPIGPVYAASPWNLPVMMPGRKIACALAAGCSVLVKPSEETPESAAYIIQCFKDAGLPGDVLNMVFGDPPLISNFLIPSPIIRKVSFTGSTPVGKELARLAGAHMKKVTMELGGHAPVIIWNDVNFDEIIPQLVSARYANSGQSCMAATRLFVHEDIHDKFTTQFVEKVHSINVGNGMDKDVGMGPLTSSRRLKHMQSLIEDAVQKGAHVLCGGKRIERPGFFFEPTVLGEVNDEMMIMKEEPFGPITPIARFSNLDEVIARANNTPYGLASYLFTKDLTVIQKVSSALDVGLLGINTMQVAGTAVPFGGVKDSGIGREGAMEGILENMVIKTISHGHVSS